MDKYIGTLSKVTDPNAKRLIMLLLQENEEFRRELEYFKHRKPPNKFQDLADRSQKPNILPETS